MTTLPVMPDQTPVGMGLDSELRGPAGVRHDVLDFLRAWLPAHAAACVAAWGLEASDLPLPVDRPDDLREHGWMAHEPAAIDRWPLVAVTTGRRTQRTIDWTEDGQQQYSSSYPVRIYSWVRAEGWDATQDQRDNLATAVQVTVLAHPDLESADRLRVNLASLLTDFSDVVSVKGDRFVAAAYVGFELHVTETLTDRLAMPGEQPRAAATPVTVQGDLTP